MHQNLIALAGLSHSGKDLLFNQLTKLGMSEPDLNIIQNVIYYDWLNTSSKKKEEVYIENLLPAIREKILMKLNTLIYIHDISYQRFDDIADDFKEITSTISAVNKHYQVILLLNRGHLIPNEAERNKIKNDLTARLQQVFLKEIPSYIVSLKGVDETRLTNMIFTQIINRSSDFAKELHEQSLGEQPSLDEEKQRLIRTFLDEKMESLGFAGAYLLSQRHEMILAVGRSQAWQEKVGPQIIRMLDQYGAFEISPTAKVNILRIEDFIMITQTITTEIKLILIGRESIFKLNSESYSTIEQICLEMANDLNSKLQ